MKVSMRDVANHASVSTATVSNVMNNTRFVSDEIQQRVLKSIQELVEYYPGSMARVFKTGKKRMIGIIVSIISKIVW